MELIRIRCPYCGKEFPHNRNVQACFCTHCGKRLIIDAANYPAQNTVNQNRRFQEEQGEEYDSRMLKKQENYKYAKRIGLAIVIISSAIAAFSVSIDEDYFFDLGYFGLLLPFIVELFFPYPDEWGIVRKAWNVFLNGIGRALLWGLIALGVFIAVSYVCHF